MQQRVTLSVGAFALLAIFTWPSLQAADPPKPAHPPADHGKPAHSPGDHARPAHAPADHAKPATPPADHGRPANPPSATDALTALKQGNERYAADKPQHPHADAKRRTETATNGQKPFALIVSCADSRVPPERLFDQGIGDLFVIRLAGNVCDTDTLGSMEYAVEHLHVPLVVVLGHTSCGAVNAIVSDAPLDGSLKELTAEIRPAVERAKQAMPSATGNELLKEAVRWNAYQGIEDTLTRSRVVRERVQQGAVQIWAAVYDIETGKVNWLGEHPDQRRLLDRTPPTAVAGEKAEAPKPH